MEKNPIGNALDGSKFGRSPESCRNRGLSLVESSECWLPIGREDSRKIFKGGTLTILNLCQWMDIEENWQQIGMIGEWGTHLKRSAPCVFPSIGSQLAFNWILICIRLDLSWVSIGIQIYLNWHPIGFIFDLNWLPIGYQFASIGISFYPIHCQSVWIEGLIGRQRDQVYALIPLSFFPIHCQSVRIESGFGA